MRIIGIDPGTGILGFGVIDVDERGRSKLVDGGVIRTPVNHPDSQRMLMIYEELGQIIDAHHPQTMSVEKLFFSQNVTTAISVAQARGVVLLLGERTGLQIFEYTPLQIKQSITGYGRADKKQMQEMVRIILGLKTVPEPDDCADALAAAICHANSAKYG